MAVAHLESVSPSCFNREHNHPYEKMRLITSVLFLIIALTQSLKIKSGKYSKPLTLQHSANTTLTPFERGFLNSTELTPKEMLDNCLTSMNPVQKTFSNKVIAFVTPSSKYGYKLALKNRGKLNIISPVWYTVRFPLPLRLSVHSYLLCITYI